MSFGATFTIDTKDFPDIGFILANNPHYIYVPFIVLAAGILLSVLVYLYRKRYVKKHSTLNIDEIKDGLKKVTVIAHGVLSTLITVAGYLILFANENQSLLQAVPGLAPYVPTLMAISYGFYNLGGNKLFKAVSERLSKFSEKSKADEAIVDNPPLTIPEDANDYNVLR